MVKYSEFHGRGDVFQHCIEDESVFVEDVTGTLGEWLSMDTSELPMEAVKALKKAYDICVKELESGGDNDD